MEINKEDILAGFLQTIEYIANKEYQKRVWIRGEGPECNDFDETVCFFFEDADSILEKYQYYEISQNQYLLLKKFYEEFEDFVDSEEREYLEKDFIDTPEWTRITEMAKEVLDAFNYQIKPKHFIGLDKNEYNYFCKLNMKYKKLLFSYRENSDTYIIKISKDQADEIRDLCSEHLQSLGYNEKHELTQEGKILESLIDKFCIGHN